VCASLLASAVHLGASLVVAYFMAAEEFEVTLVARNHTAGGSDQGPSGGIDACRIADTRAGGGGEDQEKVYRIKTLKTKQGGPASCWDLHINATLDIFGRATTLLQCEYVTHADTPARCAGLRLERARCTCVCASLTPLSPSLSLTRRAQLGHTQVDRDERASARGRAFDVGVEVGEV
jgi:hypothetical protein